MIPQKIQEFFRDSVTPFNYEETTIPEFSHKYEVANWVINSSKWPYLPITLPDFPYKEILDEARNLKPLFNLHRVDESVEKQYQSFGWSSICIHGEAWNKTETWTKYEENKGKTADEIDYKWCSEVTSLCPITTEYLKNQLPFGKYQRVRFMRLQPGGYIQPHRDRDFNMLMPLNIGLNNPEGCTFRMKGKGDVPFNQGGVACLVDIGNEHSVWNNSNEERIHLIVHGTQKDTFNDIVYDSIKHLTGKLHIY